MRFLPPQSDFIMTDWSALKPMDLISISNSIKKMCIQHGLFYAHTWIKFYLVWLKKKILQHSKFLPVNVGMPTANHYCLFNYPP